MSMSDTVDLNIPRDAAERLRVEEETGARYRERIVEIVIRFGARHVVQDVLIDALAAAMARMRSSELATKAARIAAINEENNDLIDAIARMSTERDREMEALRKELADMKRADWKVAHIKDLEGQLTERRDRVDDLDRELADAVADGENVRAELRRVSDKCRQYSDQYVKANAALEAVNAEILVRKTRIRSRDHEAIVAGNQNEIGNAAEARAERAEARVAELEDQGPGTPLGRLNGIGEFAEARGLRSSLSALSPEGCLMRAYDEAIDRAERAEAECKALWEMVHYANEVADLAMKHRDSAEAECKALWEMLEPFADRSNWYDDGHICEWTGPDTPWDRAAVNPSPADISATKYQAWDGNEASKAFMLNEIASIVQGWLDCEDYEDLINAIKTISGGPCLASIQFPTGGRRMTCAVELLVDGAEIRIDDLRFVIVKTEGL
jgi:hypothetical protein